MGTEPTPLLKRAPFNGWRLFWLVSIPISLAVIVEMLGTDLSQGEGVSHMIGYSVSFAVPIIFLVVAISPLRKLFPGPFTNWLLRNRKYIGLCFAVAMGWQGFFIFMMSNFKPEYYYNEIFFLRDELEGSTGYIFLTAMVVTSFQFGRKRLSPKQWKLLHRSGLYFLWAYPFSVYWWNLYYYANPQPVDYLLYWVGFTVFALRIVAWGRSRNQASAAYRVLGGALAAFGLVVAATGLQWWEQVNAFLTSPAWSANLELWLPYWPFEPFLSLLIVGIGTAIATTDKAQVSEPATT